MKRILLPTALLLLTIAAPSLRAVEVDPRLAAAVAAALPVCPEGTLRWEELPVALPQRFTGAIAKVESADSHCDSRSAAILSPAGNFYLGMPWPIGGAEGSSIEEKLKSFAWRMKQNMTATVTRTRTVDGLFPVTLTQVTESGSMPIAGLVDPDGKMFFMGSFYPLKGNTGEARMKAFETYLGDSPSRGAATAKVTIVEFSDFQCPSCQRASGFVDPILAKHPEAVRYVRFDLPLSGHAWAFPAALAGRAIHRQKPELFWEYKKQVYANQSALNALLFPDWARNFASDHELDLARYDADLASEPIRTEILRGAGAAFANGVRATPSYLVNGVFVDAGHDGAGLATYVEGLLK